MLLVVAACGGGSSTGNDDDDDSNPPPGGQTVNLTLISRSLDPAGDAGQIYAYIGDAPITRAQMAANLNENAPALRYQPGQSQYQATIAVPRGKVVTLFAVEFSTGSATIVNTAAGVRQTPPTKAPRDAHEFVRWEGATGSNEPGVAVFTANADMTVTAVYDLMIGYPLAHRGCLLLKVQVNGPGSLTFGPTQPDPAPDLTSTDGFANFINHVVDTETPLGYVWGKQNATVTLRAWKREQRTPNLQEAGFMQWAGTGSQCGTNLICQVTIPLRGNSPGPIVQNSSYSYNSQNQVSCPACVSTNGSCNLDLRP
jgi:hypothetical protein